MLCENKVFRNALSMIITSLFNRYSSRLQYSTIKEDSRYDKTLIVAKSIITNFYYNRLNFTSVKKSIAPEISTKQLEEHKHLKHTSCLQTIFII